MSDDFKFEPIRGLPEVPPADERILWQGSPDWRRVALDVYHVDKVAIYFALLLLWAPISAAWSGAGAGQMLASTWRGATWLVPLAGVALAMLAGLAWLTGRTSVYTITSRRIVMRIGIALPMTFNVPFRCIGAASLRAHADGSGDIPVSIITDDRIAYLVLWPHARPWRLSKPEPALRALPDAASVARILANALAASQEQNAGQIAMSPVLSETRPANAGETRTTTVPHDIALAS